MANRQEFIEVFEWKTYGYNEPRPPFAFLMYLFLRDTEGAPCLLEHLLITLNDPSSSKSYVTDKKGEFGDLLTSVCAFRELGVQMRNAQGLLNEDDGQSRPIIQPEQILLIYVVMSELVFSILVTMQASLGRSEIRDAFEITVETLVITVFELWQSKYKRTRTLATNYLSKHILSYVKPQHGAPTPNEATI